MAALRTTVHCKFYREAFSGSGSNPHRFPYNPPGSRNDYVPGVRGLRMSSAHTPPGWGCRTRTRVGSGTDPHRRAPDTLKIT